MNEKHGGVILAGGKGSRLMPLTAKLPKPLLPVGRKTPLERGVCALVDSGVNNIAITTGYLYNETEKFAFKGANLTYYRESVPMGTAGMVFEITPNLTEDFFVLSGDCVFELSLSEMMRYHKEKNAAVTIASVTSYEPTDYGTIVTQNGIVTEFREKPSWKQVISTKINGGIYIINRRVFEKYGKGCSDFASELFPILLSSGETIACFESNDYWCDMGTPQSYHQCNMHFSDGENVMGDYICISPKSKIENSVIMNGVKIGEGSKVFSSILGEGVSVGKNCYIENAVIGHDALICDDCTVKKSGAVSCDSILGKGKTVLGKEQSNISFFDSGTVKFRKTNEELPSLLGKALAHISRGREIHFFCGETTREKEICTRIYENALSYGGKSVFPQIAFPSLASFISSETNSLSVHLSLWSDEVTVLIFDETGILLSREEQIEIEKFSPSKPLPLKEKTYSKDPLEIYTKFMEKHVPTMPGTKVSFVSKNLPSTLCGKIISLKEGVWSWENEEDYNSFFISDDGMDVSCHTKEGVHLDKMHLLAIAAIYFPTEDIFLPDHVPEGIKNLLICSGGTFKLYSDSLKGRNRSKSFFSYNDGISIALGAIAASALSGLSLDEISKKLPPFAFMEKTVPFQGNKGRAFEDILATSKRNTLSGATYTTEKGKISIVPQYKNAFKIFAESASSEVAEELILEAEENLKLLHFNKSEFQ